MFRNRLDRKTLEMQTPEALQLAVTNDRHFWVLDWCKNEKGIHTGTYSHVTDIDRELMYPVPSALAQSLSKWYESLDDLVLGVMRAHVEDTQSFRAEPTQCRALLAPRRPSPRRQRRLQFWRRNLRTQVKLNQLQSRPIHRPKPLSNSFSLC